MAIGDSFSLRLDDFESNLKQYWQEIQDEDDFSDVTLACEEKQINAHKVIISSCSPILKNILKMNKNPHPLIYLRKVKYNDLEKLLIFMYQGKVDVAEEDLPTFLDMAKDLQVRGLSEGNLENYNSGIDKQMSQKQKGIANHKKTNISDKSSIRHLNEFNKTNNSYPQSESEHQIEDVRKEKSKDVLSTEDLKNEIVKSEMDETSNTSLVPSTDLKSFQCDKCDKQFSGKSGLNHHIASIHEGIRFSCDQCDYKASQKSSLKVHVESIHHRISIFCNQCNKRFYSKDNLRQHNSAVHKGVRFPCDFCDYKATRGSNLRQHKLSQHKNLLGNNESTEVLPFQ